MDRVCASLALLCAAGLGACGSAGDDPAPPVAAAAATATLGCADGGDSLAARSPTWRPTSFVSGPLTLGYVWQYAGHPAAWFEPTAARLRSLMRSFTTAHERRLARRTIASAAVDGYGLTEVPVRVDAGEQATLSVAPHQRAAVSLVYTFRARSRERRAAPGIYRVADGDPAVTFRACEERATDFVGGIVVDRARCVALTVSDTAHRRPARVRLPLGKDSCAPVPAPASRVLSRPPHLGVACPEANSIACDRVGLAVSLKRKAARVTATINGRALRLHEGRADGRGAWYRGYRQPAGLLDGSLKVTPHRGRHSWQGSHPKNARVSIDIRRAHGPREEAVLTLPARPGWG